MTPCDGEEQRLYFSETCPPCRESSFAAGTLIDQVNRQLLSLPRHVQRPHDWDSSVSLNMCYSVSYLILLYLTCSYLSLKITSIIVWLLQWVSPRRLTDHMVCVLHLVACLSFSNSFWTWATKSLPEETTLSSLFILFKLPSFPWKYFGKLCLLCFPLWTSVTAVHIFTVRLSPDLLPWRCRLLVQDDSDSLTYGAWQEQNRLQVS